MSGIKRFNHGVCEYPGGTFSEMNQEDDGDYVLHSDHEAEVARLRAELNAATKAGLDAIAMICEKEREADALRAEMEWLRSWLPPMLVLVSAVEEEFCCEETEASEPDHSKVSYPEETCPITFGMIREARKAIDYAMGESA